MRRVVRTSLLSVIPVFAAMIAGCNGDAPAQSSKLSDSTPAPAAKPAGDNPLVGKWVIDPAFIKSHKDADKDGFLTGMATTFWYEFNADKTFKGAIAEGTYVYAEGVVNLITTKMGGKALEQDGKPAGVSMPGELSKDGKKLTLHPQATDLLPPSIQTGIDMVKEAK